MFLILLFQLFLYVPFILGFPASHTTKSVKEAIAEHTSIHSSSHSERASKISDAKYGHTSSASSTLSPSILASNFPIASEYSDGEIIDISKIAPQLIKDMGKDVDDGGKDQSQKTTDMNTNGGNLLESVSGGLWGKDTGNGTSAVSTKPKASTSKTFSSISKRTVPKSFTACLKSYKVEYLDSKSKDYNQYSSPYNQRIKNKADVIVVARDIKDIADSVYCASKSDVTVQARAGGHSYASYSSGNSKGGLVIDLRYLDSVKYSSKSNTAIVEGGIRLGKGRHHMKFLFHSNSQIGNLGLALLSKGRAISHGDCPAVGLAGHSLHGGFGYTSRMWGLSTDFIIGLDVVTADGKVKYVSQTKEPDLYWVGGLISLYP